MNYNFEGLNLAVVQRILSEAIQLRDVLAARRTTNSVTLNSGEQRRQADAAELAQVTQEWQDGVEILATMPEGIEKIKKEGAVAKSNARRTALLIRLAEQSETTLPEKQFVLATLDVRIPEAEAFITALQTRVTELGG